MVPWKCAEDFVRRLIVGPRRGPQGEQEGFRVSLRQGLGHEVTEDSKLIYDDHSRDLILSQVIEEAGQWIFVHGIVRKSF